MIILGIGSDETVLNIYKKLVDKRNIYTIKKSGYFDPKYYKKEYPEVKGNALNHYYYFGYKEGKNPSTNFFNDDYLRNNVDVLNASINPLLHYLVSGRKEGREVKKYLGASICEIYEKLYHQKYSYKLYIKENSPQINLFLTVHDTSLKECIPLLKFISKYCLEEKIGLRVFYQSIDLEEFNQILKKENIKLPSNSTILKMNSRYNLEVGRNDYFFCVDFLTLSALIHTLDIPSKIYYYVGNKNNLSESETKLLSIFCQSNWVECLSDHDLNLEKYQLKAVTNTDKKLNNITNFYLDFDESFMFGLQILNDYFVGREDIPKLHLTYNSPLFQKKLHLENLKEIEFVTAPQKEDYVIQIYFQKSALPTDNPCLAVYFEKVKKEYIPYTKLENGLKLSQKRCPKSYTSIWMKVFEKIETER